MTDHDEAQRIRREARRIEVEYARRAADPDIAAYWRRVGPALDDAQCRWRDRMFQLLDGLADRKHLRVLDVGCGGGEDLIAFAAAGFDPENLVGVDLLAATRPVLPDTRQVSVTRADASALPFPARTFDTTLQSTMLSSVLDESVRRVIVSEMARVTRPGGYLISYEMRMGVRKNQNLSPLDEGTLRALFGPWGKLHLERMNLHLSIASRVPRAAAVLQRIRALRSHCLVWVQTPLED